MPSAAFIDAHPEAAWQPLWEAALQIVQRRRNDTWFAAPMQFVLHDVPALVAGSAPDPRARAGRPAAMLEKIAAGRASRVDADDEARALTWLPAPGWLLRGPWSDAARVLFDLYKPLLDRAPADPPWVIAQLGQSLDGCVATSGGDSRFVTSSDNLLHLHRLRALCDAVVVGAGTVAADNPRLTTRYVPGTHPVRVVLDPGLRVSREARVFHDADAPTLWLCDARFEARAASFVGPEQVLGVEGLIGPDGAFDAAIAIAALHARKLGVLFVEGGGTTVSRFLQQGCLDRLHLAIAPVLIGAGRAGLRLPGFGAMKDCPRPAFSVLRMGDDVLWNINVRSTQAAFANAGAS